MSPQAFSLCGFERVDGGEYATASDDATGAPSYDAVIIGSDLARRLWGDANPIGRRLATARHAWQRG